MSELDATERRVLEWMRSNRGAHLPDNIARGIDMPSNEVRLAVFQLLGLGVVQKTPDFKVTVNRRGGLHPCNDTCCDSPDSFVPDHTCSDEAVCEECYRLDCRNCGACCYCDL